MLGGACWAIWLKVNGLTIVDPKVGLTGLPRGWNLLEMVIAAFWAGNLVGFGLGAGKANGSSASCLDRSEAKIWPRAMEIGFLPVSLPALEEVPGLLDFLSAMGFLQEFTG